jgi:hypothetical protein
MLKLYWTSDCGPGSKEDGDEIKSTKPNKLDNKQNKDYLNQEVNDDK